MLRLLAIVALFASAIPGSAADKPIDGNASRPGYKPPVLIGVEGDGKGPSLRPIPFPAADEAWIGARTAHFDILSSAEEKRTRELAGGLETLAAALTRLAPSIARTSSTPTRVLLFTRHREVQPYFDYLLNRDSAHVTGVFVSQKNSGSMIVDVGSGRLPTDRTPFHELVHSLLDRNDKRGPLWLEEGMAEYFSAAELRSGSLYVGAPIVEHMVVIRRGPLMPLPQLFGVARESDAYNLPAGQRMFYAESWALVDALMRLAGPHRERFYDFVRDVDNGVPVEAALQAHFEIGLPRLEQSLRSYGGSFRFAVGATMPVPEADTSVTMAAVSRGDLLFELGSFLRALNPDSPEATRHFKAALEIDPKHAPSLAALGRYEEAIAADPKNADLFLTYAESLLGTQIGLLAEADQPEEKDVDRFRKARQLAETARDVSRAGNPDQARAYGDYGVSFMVESDAALAPGIEALQRAHALAPERNDFAVHLFAFLRRTGDRAEPLLAQLLASRNKQVAYAARSIVVRTELARANALTHKEQLDDAAAVIRKLAAETEDTDARNDLLHQAGDLEKTAAANRQITMYNDAIGQVNAGKYSAARKLLAALLTNATDPDVIRDAQKLQKELEGRRDLPSQKPEGKRQR
jgi:tetratricopeptide (TPR) repeat protein